jgi:hypothetical protein
MATLATFNSSAGGGVCRHHFEPGVRNRRPTIDVGGSEDARSIMSDEFDSLDASEKAAIRSTLTGEQRRWIMFKQYRRKQIAEIRGYVPGEVLSDRVSISAADRDAGSPKLGDMIAQNPKNHDDQWLIAKDYFDENFEEIDDRYEELRS